MCSHIVCIKREKLKSTLVDWWAQEPWAMFKVMDAPYLLDGKKDLSDTILPCKKGFPMRLGSEYCLSG